MTLQVCVVVILIGKLLRAHEKHMLQIVAQPLVQKFSSQGNRTNLQLVGVARVARGEDSRVEDSRVRKHFHLTGTSSGSLKLPIPTAIAAAACRYQLRLPSLQRGCKSAQDDNQQMINRI